MIHRQNLQFPEKDTALREDVHALGGLVGTVLTVYGRMRATTLLERRQITLNM